MAYCTKSAFKTSMESRRPFRTREDAGQSFVLISADSRRDAVVSAQRAGADGYIVKPLTAQTLKSAIEKAMDQRSASTDDYDIIPAG